MTLKKIIRQVLSLDENLLARRKWLEEALSRVPAGQRILDAGAGQLQNKPLCKHLIYTAQDICQYDGSGPNVGLHTGSWVTDGIDLVCDIAEMPAGDGAFDAVLCSEVLEHVADPVRVLKELARVTRPGGVLVLTAPFASLVHFAPYYFSTGFSRYWYEHHLKELGFEIERLERNGNWFSALWQEIARTNLMIPKSRPMLRTFAVLHMIVSLPLYALVKRIDDQELSCFGWHCIARKKTSK